MYTQSEQRQVSRRMNFYCLFFYGYGTIFLSFFFSSWNWPLCYCFFACTSYDCLQHKLCNVLHMFPGQLSYALVPPLRIVRTLVWLHYCHSFSPAYPSFLLHPPCFDFSGHHWCWIEVVLYTVGYAYWGPGCTACVVGTAVFVCGTFCSEVMYLGLGTGCPGMPDAVWPISHLPFCSRYRECWTPLCILWGGEREGSGLPVEFPLYGRNVVLSKSQSVLYCSLDLLPFFVHCNTYVSY